MFGGTDLDVVCWAELPELPDTGGRLRKRTEADQSKYTRDRNSDQRERRHVKASGCAPAPTACSATFPVRTSRSLLFSAYETSHASQPLHSEPRSSRGRVEASEIVEAAAHRHRLHRGDGAEGRGGPIRFNLSRRRARPLERRADHALQLVGADHHARCAVDGDQAHRADRHCLDHLHGTFQPRAALLVARPHQPRPYRLEYRHDMVVAGGRELRRHWRGQPRRALRARRRVHDRGEGLWDLLGR